MQLKSILVALAGTAVDPDVIRLAVAIAKPAKAQIAAIHVIEVRWNLPLDAVLENELERGERLLAEAAAIAQKLGITIETEVLQAREAAAAIVDDALERKSDLILVGMPYRRRLGRTHIGHTVETVYEKAPCAVLAYRQEAPA